MGVARQRLARGLVQVEVIDRDAGQAQAAGRRGAGQLRGQGRLAAALRPADPVDPRTAAKDVVEHVPHEARLERMHRARMQERVHGATIAE